MSDSYSGSESEDNRSNHDQYSDDREESDNREEESDSVSEQSDDDGNAESGGVAETSPIVGKNNLRLCSLHAAGSMTLDCKFCKAALGVISDNNIKKQLTQNLAQSGLVSRYAGRCDIQPATLTLGASSLEIGQAIFSKGVFRDRKAWQDIVRKFLTLPQFQHDLLTADIKTEDIINKYKNEKRFQYIFRFHKDIVDILRNLRVSQRPLLSLIEKNHDAILSVRRLGEDAGVSFPENAPEKVGGTVPRDGHSLTDQLHVSSSDGLFPLPDMESLIDSASLNEFQARKVADFIEGFGSSVGDKYMELFKAAATYINVAEDQLVFYTDLYSHVDASLREVIREKMSSLFRSHVKSDVLRQTSSKQLSDKPSGFFGGSVCFDIFCYLIFLILI